MIGTGKNIYAPFVRDTPCVLLYFVVYSQHMRRHIQKLTTIASVLMLLCVSIVHADVGGGSTSISRERIGYLSAGDTHTCVVLVDNSVKCFGLGNEGQLGNESTSNIGDGIGASVASSSAISLGLGRSARAIATGTSHYVCVARQHDGEVLGIWRSMVAIGYGDSVPRRVVTTLAKWATRYLQSTWAVVEPQP